MTLVYRSISLGLYGLLEGGLGAAGGRPSLETDMLFRVGCNFVESAREILGGITTAFGLGEPVEGEIVEEGRVGGGVEQGIRVLGRHV
jgi:hypothetical protein